MRFWPRLAYAAAAIWLIAGLVGATTAEPLRLRYAVWVGFGPLFVAQEKDFFAQEGVEVELINLDDHTAAFAAFLRRPGRRSGSRDPGGRDVQRTGRRAAGVRAHVR